MGGTLVLVGVAAGLLHNYREGQLSDFAALQPSLEQIKAKAYGVDENHFSIAEQTEFLRDIGYDGEIVEGRDVGIHKRLFIPGRAPEIYVTISDKPVHIFDQESIGRYLAEQQ